MSDLCNATVSGILVPTISEYFNGVDTALIVLTALAGFFTLGTIVLFGAHYVAITKWVTDDDRQSALIQLALLFPVTTVLGFIGLCVPRTLTVMKAFVILFSMRTLFVYAGFIHCLFGGRRKMSLKLRQASSVISFRSRPCCCCCICLPVNVQPNERNLAITEWIILQAPVIHCVLVFGALIEATELGGIQTAWFAQVSNLVDVVSSLLAMYGCTVLTTVANDYLREYHVTKILRLLHLNIILFQLQGGIFEGDPYAALFVTHVYTINFIIVYINVLLSLEMLLISAYVTVSLHPEKNATFDRHPTRPEPQTSLEPTICSISIAK